jgi:hypothetical protein
MLRILVCGLFLAGALLSQNILSSVSGTIVDGSGAPVPEARCTLTNRGNGASFTAQSGAAGAFTFPAVSAGSYSLSVRAAGFKTLDVKNIVVTSSEVHALGNISLQIGEVRESVSVTAEQSAVQLMSAEHSGVVTGNQLNDIALKGRDFFAFLSTIPGIVDTNGSRESTTNASNGGTFINGARDNQKNFSVDGITDMDVGSNQSLAFMPNMDAIEEVKVLTSNYQAEYGRNSGGAVTVITKAGTRDFHGSGYDYYRHESLNANSFFNNRTGTPKAPYRYRISGYSIGGPVFIPKHFNTSRQKYFFFFSQEYTGVKKDYGTQFVNVPTAAERNGDFSQSRDVNGALIPIRDPSTGAVFPGNIIPQNRIASLGQSVLNFFPLPNYVDPDPRNQYRYNYRSTFSGNTPRRNDILRLDANLTPTFMMYYRFGHDKDLKELPWGDWKTGSINYLLSPVEVQNPGVGHLVRTTKTFSATAVNEAIFGYNRTLRDFDFADPALAARSAMGNPPKWYSNPSGAPDYIPDVMFGGQPTNTVQATLSAAIPNHYIDKNYTFTDNFSKVWGTHNFKAGIYVERIQIEHVANVTYRGSFDFSRNTNNPFDTNDSFSNALLGRFNSYKETSNAPYGRFRMWNFEYYLQDNWRVSKRLTLDYGLRFYNMLPMQDLTHNASTFDPTLFDPANAPLLYRPGLNAAGQRVALDPLTGNTTYAALIGQYVPGTGNTANGAATAGVNGYSSSLINRPGISYGPRFGFAYDVFGNGKTAVRGGFGLFYDTGQTNPIRNSLGNPPTAYTPVLYYGDLGTYQQSAGAIGPSTLSILYGRAVLPSTMNFSLGVQHQVAGMLLDASYVGSLSRHLQATRNINPIAMYARFDPQNLDPTQPGKPLPDNFYRPFSGYGDLNSTEWIGTSNYNSLQVSLTRRYASGFQFGVAYTFSKALGITSSDGESISPYFSPRSRNYGPLSFDRTHNLVINYIYDLPKLAPNRGWKPAHWVLDNWQLSGITSFTSGAPFTPSFTTVDSVDVTGSQEAARITVTGDPNLSGGDRTYYRNFNTAAFARTPVGGFGNGGVNYMRGPGVNNWDIALGKQFRLFSESSYLRLRGEAFNAWNHTQFASYYTTARFDAAGNQVDPNFGAFASARMPRVIQLSARIVF